MNDDRLVILSSNLGIGNVDIAPVHTLYSDVDSTLRLESDTTESFDFRIKGNVAVAETLQAGGDLFRADFELGNVDVLGNLSVGGIYTTLRVDTDQQHVGIRGSFGVGNILSVDEYVAVQSDFAVIAPYGNAVQVDIASETVTVDADMSIAEGRTLTTDLVLGNVEGASGTFDDVFSTTMYGNVEGETATVTTVYGNVSGGNVNVTETVTADSFVGNANSLFSIPAGNLVDTIDNARLPAQIAVSNISANGSGLSSLNLANVYNTLGVGSGGTGVATSTGSGNVVLNVSPTMQGVVTIAGNVVASNITGNGSGVSSLNLANVYGTLAVGSGGTGVTTSTGTGNVVLNVNPTMQGVVTIAGNLAASNIRGNVDGVFSIPAGNLTGTIANARLPAIIAVSNVSGNGSGLSSLNLANVYNTLAVGNGGTGVTTSTGTGNVVLNVSPTMQGVVTITGNVVASNVAGNGAGLSSVNLANVYGTLAVARGGTGVTNSTGSGNVVLNVSPTMQGLLTVAGNVAAETAQVSTVYGNVIGTSLTAQNSHITTMYGNLAGQTATVDTLYGNLLGQSISVSSFQAANGVFDIVSGNLDASWLSGNILANFLVDIRDFAPQYDDVYSLGNASNRWGTVYANNMSIGSLVTTFISGDGYKISNVNAANIAGIVPVAHGGTGVSTSTGSGNIVLNTSPTLQGVVTVTGNVNASNISGNADGISSIPAGNLAGTIANARLPAIIAVANVSGNGAGLSSLNLANVYGTLAVSSGGTGVTTSTGSGNLVLNVSPTLQGTVTLTGNLAAANIRGNADGVSAVPAGNLAGTIANARLPSIIAVANVSGNGAGLSSLNLANVYGTLAVGSGGTGVTTSTGSGNLVLNVSPTFQGTVTLTGNLAAANLSGNADGLSSLPAGNLAGTISNARLPSVIAVANVSANGFGLSSLNLANVYGTLAVASGGTGVSTSTGTGNVVLNVSPTLQGTVTLTGNLAAANIRGNSDGISAVPAGNLAGTIANARLPAIIAVANVSANGAGLSSLNLANVYGTLAVASGGTGVTTSTGSGNAVLNVSPTFQGTVTMTGNVNAANLSGNANGISAIAAGNLVGTVNNARLPAIIAVANVSANGAGLTSLNLANVYGTLAISSGGTGVTTSTGTGNLVLNVSPTFQGTLTTANISAGNLTATGNVSATYMLGNGAFLTGIVSGSGFDGNASNITTGTLSNGRLPSAISVANVAGNGAGLTSLNLANVYSTLGVGSGGTGVTTSTGSGNLVLNVSPTFQGTMTLTGNLLTDNLSTANLSAANLSAANLSTSNLSAINISATGNLSAVNISATSNLSAANLSAANILATGNISATYVLGNGAFLTGIVSGSGFDGNASNITIGTLSNARLPPAISVSNVTANGSGLSSINLANVYGTLAIASGGTGVTTSTGTGNVVLNVNPTFQGTVTTANISVGNLTATGNVSATYMLGNGAFLTGIVSGSGFDGNASNITIGTLSNARLPSAISVSNVAANGAGLSSLNLANVYGILGLGKGGTGVTTGTGSGNLVFSASPTFQGNSWFDGNVSVQGIMSVFGSMNGNANGISSVPAGNLAGTISNARLPSAISVSNVTANGAGLTSLNLANVYGTLAVASGGTGVTTSTGTGNLALNVSPTFQGTVTFSGNVNAANLTGNADGISSIPAGNLTGTVSNARLTGDYTVANVTARAVKSLPATSLSLWSNNVQRVTITTAGNVGINKTVPNYPLDVVGNIAGSAGLALGIGGGGGYMTLDPSGISDVGTGGDPYFPSTGLGANCLGDENTVSIASGSIKFFTGPARDKLMELSNTGALTAGNVNASNVSGNGAGLSSLNLANVYGTLAVGSGGTGVTASTGSGNAVLNVSPTFQGTVTLTGNLVASNIRGNVDGVSSVPAGNLAGTISNARLPSVIAVANVAANGAGLSSLNLANVYGTLAVGSGGTGVTTSTGTGNIVLNVSPTFQGTVTLTGNVNAANLSGNANGLSSIPAGNLAGTIANARLPSTISVSNISANGAGLSSLNLANVYGTLAVGSGGTGVTTSTGTGNIVLNVSPTFQGTVTLTGNVNAANLSGNGAGLSSLNASNLSSGTVPNSLLPSTISVSNITSTAASFTTLSLGSGLMAATDISANSLALNVLLGNTAIFAGNVAVATISGNADGLFSIPAANLTGTIANARLPSVISVANVTANGAGLSSLNLANVYGTLGVGSGGTGVTTSTGTGNLVLNVSPTFQGTVTLTGNVNAANLSGNADGISAVPAGNLAGIISNARLPAAISVSNISGNGAGLSSLNLANVYGTLAVGSGGTGVTTSTGSGNIVLNVSPTFQGTVTMIGNVNAANLSGNGDGISSIPAGNLAGTVSNARLAGDYTVANLECRAMKSIAANSLTFWSNAVQRMVITRPGNVGIGKSSADHPLDVAGNIAGSNGLSLGYSTGGYVSLFQGFNMNTAADPNYPYYGIGANATTLVTSVGGYGGINFYTNSSTPSMSVLGQWVGVGTAAPMSNLHVIGTTTLAGATTLAGTTTLQQMTEVLTAKTGATGVVTHDFTTGTLFYHSSIAANFTCNLTNVPTTDSRSVVTALVLNQGVTPYMCNAFQINGAAQTLKWQGGSAPTGTASKIDVLTFSLIRTGAAWYVLGQNANFG